MESKTYNGRLEIDYARESNSEDDTELNGNAGLLEKHLNHADPEALLPAERASTSAAEYQVRTHVKYLYLVIYFTLNLALTIYNKIVLGKVDSHQARSLGYEG